MAHKKRLNKVIEKLYLTNIINDSFVILVADNCNLDISI